MAFRREEESRGLDLPSLIDVVFLLLIFFLVTMQFSVQATSTKQKGAKPPDVQLPHARGAEDVPSDDMLTTLLFQIQYAVKGDSSSPRIVYALQPSSDGELTRSEALQIAKRDSMFAEFPQNFLRLSDNQFKKTQACQLISDAIYNYKEEHFHRPSLDNTVEIRAEKDVEFRIINFIMQECSAYKDTIPRVIFRTLAQVKD